MLEPALMLAGATLIGTALALLFGRELWLHCLIFIFSMIVLPLAVMLGRGYPYGSALFLGGVSLLYLLGLLMVWQVVGRKLPQDPPPFSRTDGQARAWKLAFLALLGADALIRYQSDLLLSGSMDTSTIANTSYVVLSAISVNATVLLALFCVVAQWRKIDALTVLSVLAFLGYSLLVYGRRQLVLDLIILVMMRSPWFLRSISVKRLLTLTAAATVTFVILTPVFVSLRANALHARELGATNAVQALAEGLGGSFQDLASGSSILSATSANLADRGSTGSFLSEIEQTKDADLNGAITWNSIQRSLPSFLADKPPVESEQLIQASFGMPLLDVAISIPAIALADFGVAGVFVAGVMVAALCGFLLALYRSRLNGMIRACALAVFFNVSFNIETDLLDYLVMLRNLTIVAVLVSVVSLFVQRAAPARNAAPHR